MDEALCIPCYCVLTIVKVTFIVWIHYAKGYIKYLGNYSPVPTYTTVGKIFTNTDHCSTSERKMQLLSKSILRRFEHSRCLFSPPVLLNELTFHKGNYILFKDPLKRHSHYIDVDAILGYKGRYFARYGIPTMLDDASNRSLFDFFCLSSCVCSLT